MQRVGKGKRKEVTVIKRGNGEGRAERKERENK